MTATMDDNSAMSRERETLIPHANFRWVLRKPNSPSFVGQEKVLQQSFTCPSRHGFIWRDVPVTEEAT